MNILKGKHWLYFGIAAAVIFIVMIPAFAVVYVDPIVNHENPPDSNVILEDAFSTVTGADSYVHPDNPQQVVVTEDEESQRGGIWYKYPIDLNYDFSFEMYIYLGNKDRLSLGADGMTFTMHNDSRGTEAIASSGAGLGAYGGSYIQNALTIEMDTFINTGANQRIDWDVDLTATTHFGLVIPDTFANIELIGHTNLQYVTDGYFLMDEWRSFTVDWNSGNNILSYQFEGLAEQSYPVDVDTVFKSNYVYWGFTGSTGGSTNFQSISVSKLPQEPDLKTEKKLRNVTSGESIFQEKTDASYGDTIEFQVTTLNLSSSIMDLIDTELRDALDTSLEYMPGSLTVNNSVVTPTISGNDISVIVGDIPVGQQAVVTFQCKVTGNGSDGIIPNKAVVGSKYSAYLDTNTVEINILPDISLKKTVDKSSCFPGETIQYTITLANDLYGGPWSGSIADTLPADLGDISVSIDDTDYSGPALYPLISANVLSISGIRLPGGEKLTITIEAVVKTENSTLPDNYVITNQAAAISGGELVNSNQVSTGIKKDFAALKIIKQTDTPVAAEQLFVFRVVQQKSETDPTDPVIHYLTVAMAPGETTASVLASDLPPAFYTVTELDSSWRYTIDSSTQITQQQVINWSTDHLHEFQFKNNRSSNTWSAGNSFVINNFSDLS